MTEPTDEKPAVCVAKDCDCPKCRKKELERREGEALSTGFVLGVAGAAVIAASVGGKGVFRLLGHMLDAKTGASDKAGSPKPKRKAKKKVP